MRPKKVARSRPKSDDSGSERGPGRPPVEDPKAEILSLRLAQADVAKLGDLVRWSGRKRSVVIRELIEKEHSRVRRARAR